MVTKTLQGTRYRTPKPGLSFRQAVQLYSMTLVLLRKETKWTGKSDSPPPDWNDFAGRLSHQLPQQIQDGETAGFFLYRPAVVSHGLSKHEFEERADVVLLTREKNIFQTTQLPVYLTVDQKSWSPAWITAKDEASDPTLTARKFEHDWTRLDGPYLWYRADQLDGSVVYRATIRFAPDNVVIEAERQIASRGAVKRVPRPRNYDPLQMTAFDAASEVAAQAYDPLSIDPPALEEQLSGISRPRPHLSNAFRAWCKYGLDNPE